MGVRHQKIETFYGNKKYFGKNDTNKSSNLL
jgi:hypothetical protein